jgi:hypothetical protein
VRHRFAVLVDLDNHSCDQKTAPTLHLVVRLRHPVSGPMGERMVTRMLRDGFALLSLIER